MGAYLGLGCEVEEEKFSVESHEPDVDAFWVRGQRLGHDLADGIDRDVLRAKERVSAKVRELKRIIKKLLSLSIASL